MGYNTEYTITIINKTDHKIKSCEHKNPEHFKYCHECGKEIKEELDIKNVVIEYLENLQENYYFNPFNEPCKWYDHEKHMATISIKYADIIICIEGYGEDYDDHWRKYFLNGKMQHAEAIITFEPFDPAKLK